MKVSMLKAL